MMVRLEQYEMIGDEEDFDMKYGKIRRQVLIGAEVISTSGDLKDYADITVRCRDGRILHFVSGDFSICEWKHEQKVRDDPHQTPGERIIPEKGVV